MRNGIDLRRCPQKGNQLLTDCLVGSIDVTMAEEDAYAKLVDVAADNHVGVAENVDSSLVIVTADSKIRIFCHS